MVNLLRMDLYRMFKGKMFWVCLAVVVVMSVFEAGLMWFSTSDAFMDMINSSSSDDMTFAVTSSTGEMVSTEEIATMASMPQLQYVSQVALGIVPLLAVIVTAVFCAAEFDNGFAKNIFSMKPGRFGYFASKVIVMLIATIALLVTGMLVSLAAVSVAGFDMATSPLSDWAVWLALATLVLMAYELLVSGLYWVSRSKVATLIVALLVIVGLVGTLLSGFLNLVSPTVNLAQYLLFSSMSALNMQEGSFAGFDFVLVIGVALAYAIVGGVAGAVALKKKDV